jgi:methionyl-tRNA formyltransferase
MRIVYMGSAEFGIPALQKLQENGHTIAGIVSTPARPQRRGLKMMDSPITLYAREHNLWPVFTPESLKSDEFSARLAELHADIFVVVAFRILPPAIFLLPKFGTVNIHASLLPQFRGPAPIQRAIATGAHETGVTVFRIDEGVDTGMIMVQKKTALGDLETTPELYNRLSILGADALIEALDGLEHGHTSFITQNAAQATPAPKLTKDEGCIDWNLPAKVIFNRIRAFKPFPGTYTFLNGIRIGVEWALPADADDSGYAPGTLCAYSETGFYVQCNSSRLNIISVKPEGKKTMSALAFIQGRHCEPGTKFDAAPVT